MPNFENLSFLSSGNFRTSSSPSKSLYLYFFLSIKTGKWIRSPISSGTFLTVAQFWMMTLPSKGFSLYLDWDFDV